MSRSGGRQGGRPREENPRYHTISARFTRAEYERVLRKILGSGLTKSEAVRILLLNDELPKKVHGGIDPGASESWAKLSTLQANINQIAKRLNESRLGGISVEGAMKIVDYVRAVEVQVRALRAEIVETKAGLRG